MHKSPNTEVSYMLTCVELSIIYALIIHVVAHCYCCSNKCMKLFSCYVVAMKYLIIYTNSVYTQSKGEWDR